MRKDMKHVIIDRPRTGGDGGKSILPKGSKKRLQKTPLEDQPGYASSARRRVYGYDCKQLNEHLSPLVRWLQKQVGRNWDEVWSEICDGLSVRNATTAHVRDHADQYVEKNCTINEKGEICDSRGMFISDGKGIPGQIGGGRWREFYVDPRDNTLRAAGTYRRWRYQEKKKDWIPGKDENHRYYLLKGVWFEVIFKPFPGAQPKRKRSVYRRMEYDNPNRVWDAIISYTWEREDKKKYSGSYEHDCSNRYGSQIYADSKRQLNKHEIRKLKLRETDVA